MWTSRHVNYAFWFTPSLPLHGKPSVNQVKTFFGAHHEPKTWNDHILTINYPIEMSQRTDLMTIHNQKIVLVCGAFNPYATKRPMFEKVVNGVIFGDPDIQNQLSDFCKRRCALHNTCRRTSGPSLSLWQILQLWQDRSKHQFSENWVP